jgi:hypothetical protein
MTNPPNRRPRAEALLGKAMLTLRVLTLAAAEDFRRDFDLELSDLGVESKEAAGAATEAEERLEGLAARIEATTTFEVLLADLGGEEADCRLCFECQGAPSPIQPDPHTRPPTEYQIRRVLFRWSREVSIDLGLTPEETEIAERFGRRVVPELGE